MQNPATDFEARDIRAWHAHVYYSDADQRALAAVIREAAGQQFELSLGRWRDEPVGPHPLPMYQIAFGQVLFSSFVPWLLSVHGSLSILVHARTGKSDLMDHTAGAMWLGVPLELNLDFFDEDGKSA